MLLEFTESFLWSGSPRISQNRANGNFINAGGAYPLQYRPDRSQACDRNEFMQDDARAARGSFLGGRPGLRRRIDEMI